MRSPARKNDLGTSGKRKLLLLVVIHSAPSRLDRRNAIRETWIKECQTNPDAVCRFITDGQDPKGQPLERVERIKLEHKSRVYGDILLTEAPGGVNFAVKYLWMLQWANESYDFQYNGGSPHLHCIGGEDEGTERRGSTFWCGWDGKMNIGDNCGSQWVSR